MLAHLKKGPAKRVMASCMLIWVWAAGAKFEAGWGLPWLLNWGWARIYTSCITSAGGGILAVTITLLLEPMQFYAAGRKGRVPVHQDHVPAHLAVLRLALVAVSQESWRAGPSTQVSPKASLDPLRLAAVVKGPASPHCCLKRGRSLFCTRPPPTPGSKVSAPLSSTLQEIKIKKAGRQTIKAWVFRFLFSRTQ